MSKLIHTPTLANVTDHGPTSSTFTIEPLHTGYGMTLGNSLRRVLLSSIAGAAVTGFRIEGISHEFTTVKGVKEDVVAIMLNLKGIRFKVYSDETQILRLSKKGRGPVKAKDIELNADVEVVNTDHLVATIDSDKGSINMELQIETGRGYRPLEEHASARKTSDMVLLDAVFSPVLRVRYRVENTRVGQITNLDKLLITVDTDGSITPREAFEEAAAILINQYTALAGQTRVEAALPLSDTGLSGEGEDDTEEPAELMTSIEDLNLSARTTNALVNNDIHTIKDLLSLSEAELRDLKGFGNKALEEVKDKIAELEL
ncbi:DNA-directed RNA polymerase subunit alpha [Candidatus Saccharibacteria bacterium RIFCSPHIGHO2_12_FULL_49_19]|nr:MAG: DNA-directed RNA polymerase subunit alpha [Candidatus Saccharibacteria bacterium RIFCSPHIGHO2_01_FULL_49_21]OGL37778.1 MAG: DNA-directed RNA polymerase subunit alpha [Candidatus Saccharibacteria bacterium RIFCSPHIGHO2_12_FULL_49_19]OGL38569.1 MAG: DNA-directed RNA polymerase subunit alpha [Candidatus Saccharibacteria bacterium RIFCSPLOWO2_01_FULL_49_22]